MCTHILALIMGVDFKTKNRHDKAANRFDVLILTIYSLFPKKEIRVSGNMFLSSSLILS